MHFNRKFKCFSKLVWKFVRNSVVIAFDLNILGIFVINFFARNHKVVPLKRINNQKLRINLLNKYKLWTNKHTFRSKLNWLKRKLNAVNSYAVRFIYLFATCLCHNHVSTSGVHRIALCVERPNELCCVGVISQAYLTTFSLLFCFPQFFSFQFNDGCAERLSILDCIFENGQVFSIRNCTCSPNCDSLWYFYRARFIYITIIYCYRLGFFSWFVCSLVFQVFVFSLCEALCYRVSVFIREIYWEILEWNQQTLVCPRDASNNFKWNWYFSPWIHSDFFFFFMDKIFFSTQL